MSKKYLGKCKRLIFLLVTIFSLYSFFVYADLSEIEARGIDNVKNFIRGNDFVIFKATASISGDTDITPNQVLLGSGLEFDSCSAGINGFVCQLRFPGEGTENFDVRSIPYTINLKNDDGNIINTKSDLFFVDDLAPTLNSFELDENLLDSGIVKFSFSAEDKACNDQSCAGICSGITKIELFEQGSSFEEIIDINTNSCTFSDTFETTILFFSEGEHTVFAKVFDKLNQVSSVLSVSFELDTTPPSIDLGSFRITDETDLDINFFGVNPVPMTVKVEIIDFDLDKNNVFADLNDLNENANLRNIRAVCGETKNDVTTCSWDIILDPDGAGLKTFTINASDNSNNQASTTIAKNFELDDTGPIVLSLASSRVFEGQSFAKLQDNIFIATFREDGIGLKPADIKLHASSIVAADSCELIVDIWKCTWNNVDLNIVGQTTVFIDTDSTDRLGNAVPERFSTEVTVDNTVPLLLKLNISNIGGAQAAFQDFTKTGDKLLIKAAVQDDSIDQAFVDLSKFIFNAGNVSADRCDRTSSNTFVCSWTTSSINIEGFISDVLTFRFTDIAGNTLEISEQFTVFGLSGETEPDFFDHVVKCSPSVLNRETFPLINQRAFCQVSLIPKSLFNSVGTFENVETGSISLGECQGDLSFVDSVELFNAEAGSTEPFIKINFARQNAEIDEIAFNCPLNIISKQGNNIVSATETENIETKFQFFNQPLGEVSDSVQQKIDDAVEDANGILLDTIGILSTITFYAEKGCQIGNAAANVIAIFKLIGNFKALWNQATIATPLVGVAEADRITWDTLTENLRREVIKEYPFVTKVCNLVTCQSILDDDEFRFDFEGPDSILGGWRKGGRDLLSNLDFGGVVANYIAIDEKTGGPGDPTRFLNPRDSIGIALLTGCIPGIIHGAEKYRQIQCMYADCLQTGVGKQGLPVFACEDQKDYATCKYFYGEAFKIFPLTAAFDRYAGLIKDTLSNPFKILGAGMAAACNPEYFGKPFSYDICAGTKIISFLGVTIQQVTSIFDADTWTIQEDYCDRLEEK